MDRAACSQQKAKEKGREVSRPAAHGESGVQVGRGVLVMVAVLVGVTVTVRGFSHHGVAVGVAVGGRTGVRVIKISCG